MKLALLYLLKIGGYFCNCVVGCKKTVLRAAFLSVITLTTNSYAQVQDNNAVFAKNTLFVYDTRDKNLPQNSIQDLCFDNQGFLWVATFSGLARFDGRSFKNFGILFNNKPVLGFARGHGDTLFAFIYESSDQLTKRSVQIITHGTVINSVPADSIMKQYGVPLFDYSQFASITFPDSGDINPYLNGLDGIYSYGSSIYNKDTVAAMKPGATISFYKNGRATNIPPIKIDSYQKCAVLHRTIVCLNNSQNNLSLYTAQGFIKTIALPYQSKTPWTLHRSGDNLSFFLQNGSTLYQVTQNEKTGEIVYCRLLDNFIEIPVVKIINLNNDILIAASLTKGLYVYKKNKIATFRDSTISVNTIYPQAPSPDNKGIIGILGDQKIGALPTLFNKNGMVKRLGEDKASYKLTTTAIFKDSYNNYWYPGIVYDSIEKTALRKIVKSKDPASKTPQGIIEIQDQVYAYFEDSKQRVWVVSRTLLGYCLPGSNTFHNLTSIFEQPGKSLPEMRILTVAEDREGNFLMGGTNGIYIFNPDKPDTPAPALPYALSGVDVRHIEIDKATGRIWAGTKGKGLCSIKNNGKTIVYFPVDKNEILKTVHCFVTDKNGLTWLSTNNGLFVTSQKSLQNYDANDTGRPFYYRLSTINGLTSNEFNGSCQAPMILLPDSSLSISSIDGLGWINTGTFSNPFPNNPFFIETSVNGTINHPDKSNTLYLDHQHNTGISFLLSYADWNEPENIEIAYQFGKPDNADSLKWQEIAADNKITIPFLPTGNYTLTIRKRTGFEPNDYAYQSIVIKVAPRWYETNWFFVMLLLFGLLLIISVAYIRGRLLKQANKRLRAKIDAATHELEEKNQELTMYNETKNKLLSLFGHDISVPMFYISQALSQIISNKEFYQLSPTLNETIHTIENTTSDLTVLMDDLLYWIKIQQNNIKLHLNQDPVIIKEIVDKIVKLFGFRITSQNIKVSFDIDENFTIITDERLFTSILYNVLSNAIKFSHTGFFNVRLLTDNAHKNEFSLIFENSIGHPETIETALQNTKSSNIQSRGIGLMLVEDFATKLGFTVNHYFGAEETFTLVIHGLIDRNAAAGNTAG